MNLDVALKIFTLGVRYGNKKTKTGLDIDKMSDERLSEILLEGFEAHIIEVEALAKKLNAETEHRSWYSENFTARSAYRFGMVEGHQTKDEVLTDEKINECIQKTFRQCGEY